VRYPHFDFYPGDWVHDANNRYQSLAAKGAHIELLCLMWNEATETQFGLIDDDRGLARALGIPVEEWKTLRADLIDGPYAVLQVEDGRIISRRLREEWRKALDRSDKAQQSRRARSSLARTPTSDGLLNERSTTVVRPLNERTTNVVPASNDRGYERTTSHQSPITDHQSPDTDHQTPIPDHPTPDPDTPPQDASHPGPAPRDAAGTARRHMPPAVRALVTEWRAALVADGLAPPRDWHLRAAGYVTRWLQHGATLSDLRAWWAWVHEDPWWRTRYPETQWWDRAWTQWRLERASPPGRDRPRRGGLQGAAAVDALLGREPADAEIVLTDHDVEVHGDDDD
jgi:uncharacterized protein YdaU (DUF1376 family)